jgi:hypothetical protein
MSWAFDPSKAWRVDFFFGDMRAEVKGFPLDYVRAVRSVR